MHVALQPVAESTVVAGQIIQFCLAGGGIQSFVGWVGKVAVGALDFLVRKGARLIANTLPLLLDLFSKNIRRKRTYQNFNARFEFIVAPTELVIDAHNSFQITKQVLLRQKLTNQAGDDRSATQAATYKYSKTQSALSVLYQLYTNVMHHNSGPITGAGIDSDFELAREKGEFRVKSGPLANQFTIGTRIGHLIGSNPGKLVSGGIANTVAAGLVTVHLYS